MPFRGDDRAYGEFEALTSFIDPRPAFGSWPDGTEDTGDERREVAAPEPALPSLDIVCLPELVVDQPQTIFPHQRLTWPGLEEEPPAAQPPPSRMIWRVLMTSGVLVTMALLALLIRVSGNSPF
jgi:hypothetical protein